MAEKLELKIGEFYRVELYPDNELKLSKYLGHAKTENVHVFLVEEKDPSFILLDDHWISKEGQFVSYKQISSASVEVISREKFDINLRDEHSRLLKIINELPRGILI